MGSRVAFRGSRGRRTGSQGVKGLGLQRPSGSRDRPTGSEGSRVRPTGSQGVKG